MTPIQLDWAIGVAGILIGLVGLWASIAYGGTRRPRFAIRRAEIEAVDHPNLHMRYKNRGVGGLSLVRFVFWNSGRREIRREDLPAAALSPRLVLPEGLKVLDWRVATTTGDRSAGLIPVDSRQLAIGFEFLNRGDAVVGEVLCEVASHQSGTILLEGSVKGARLKEGDTINLRPFDHIFFVGMLFVILGFGYISITGLIDALNRHEYARAAALGLLGMFITGAVYVDVRYNLMSIPDKIQPRFARFLDSGLIPDGLRAEWAGQSREGRK